jgi:hypothetical protein
LKVSKDLGGLKPRVLFEALCGMTEVMRSYRTTALWSPELLAPAKLIFILK